MAMTTSVSTRPRIMAAATTTRPSAKRSRPAWQHRLQQRTGVGGRDHSRQRQFESRAPRLSASIESPSASMKASERPGLRPFASVRVWWRQSRRSRTGAPAAPSRAAVFVERVGAQKLHPARGGGDAPAHNRQRKEHEAGIAEAPAARRLPTRTGRRSWRGERSEEPPKGPRAGRSGPRPHPPSGRAHDGEETPQRGAKHGDEKERSSGSRTVSGAVPATAAR